MSKHLLRTLHQSFRHRRSNNKRAQVPRRGRTLAYESLESRQLLAVVPLASLSVSENTGEKPQSKVWEHAGQWWTVMPNSSGTWVFRLDGTSWTPTVQITTNNSVHADVKPVGDLAHVLLLSGDSAQLATLQYDGGPDNRFELWALRPQLVNVPLAGSVETATLEVDSTGRMWVAYDVSSTIDVRYSDGLYTNWSAPITVASGINSDDIGAIVAMPNNRIGVLWSNQTTDRFGFRMHFDGTAPTLWSADEVPASQSALGVGGGMADDHLNVAVASDGTLYAAVKTSYDKSGYPKIALLVRRPNGAWDNLYQVDTGGTRPIVVLSEAANRLIVAYTTKEGGGDIVYRESPLGNISFGARQVLIAGSVNDVTSTKQNFTNNVVFLASGGGAKGVRFSFDAVAPANQPPLVNAGADGSIAFGSPVALDGTVSDDGRPAPGALSTSWAKISGAGAVTFGNGLAVDTTANFSLAGTYVLRLTAGDGQFSRFDDVTITVTAPSPTPPVPQTPPPPPTQGPQQIAFQDGLFPSVTYAGTTDTKLNSGSKSTNYGNAASFEVDGKPDVAALFRWDVSAIPNSSIVVSAAIELNAITATNDNFEVYALQRAWDELSATWNQYAFGSAWTGAGGQGAGDRGTAAMGQLGPTSSGIHRIALNEAGVAAVQAWVNQPSRNFGIIIQDYLAADGVQVSSSEAATKSLRPKLVINYHLAPPLVPHTDPTPPTAPPVNLLPTVSVGADLSVQAGQWLNLAGVIGNDGSTPLDALTIRWVRSSGGSGTVTFENDRSAVTRVQFSQAGRYVLRLTVRDADFNKSFDELVVTVTEPIAV
jgi:hypothetical protein